MRSRGSGPPEARSASSRSVAPAIARTASSARRRLRIGPSGPGCDDDAGCRGGGGRRNARDKRAALAGGRSSRISLSLLERRLELRSRGHATRSARRRAERGLDRGPLALGAEVRAQASAEVARPADVEHLVVRVAEEVDARTRGRSEGERALRIHAARRAAPRARGRRRPCGRRAPARARGARRGSPPSPARRGARGGRGRPRCRRSARGSARPTRAARPASSRRASQTVSRTGAAIRRPSMRSTSRSRKPRSKRALWATSTASPAKARNRRTALEARGAPRRSRSAIPVSLRSRREAAARGRRTSRRCSPGRARRPHGPDLADPVAARREPGRLEVDDDVGRRLERQVVERRAVGEARRAPPRQARRASPPTTSSSRLAREPCGAVREREESGRRLLGRHRAVPLLDELDEPVGGVERELHERPMVGEHMFASGSRPHRRNEMGGCGPASPRPHRDPGGVEGGATPCSSAS